MAVDAALRAMLGARSVAVVGASPKPDTPGNHMVKELLVGGFDGETAAVNPKYDEVEGVACYPSLAEVSFAPDLVLLGVGNGRLEEQMKDAAASGARGVVVFASALEDPPREPPLTGRIRRIARESGMAVCGANCMGFADVERGLRALAYEERPDLAPGNIAWISHSGSAFTALLHANRGIRFNLAVSPGQELTNTMADYVFYALERESTEVLALYLETVRDPENFKAALEAAAERDVPVVALKVGRSPTAGPLVTAHSGALAGDDGAYEALFDAYGVSRVGTLNEMSDLLELLAAGRRAAPGGLASVHDSGGERAHLVDAAADLGVPLAEPSKETLRRIADRLEPGSASDQPAGRLGDRRWLLRRLSRLLPLHGRRSRHRGLRLRGRPAQRAYGPRSSVGRGAGLGLDRQAVRRGLRCHQRHTGESGDVPARGRHTGAGRRRLGPSRLPPPLRAARREGHAAAGSS